MRYVCRAQVASLGAGGCLRDDRGMDIDIVGWRPVGGANETV